jgi:hypothetical protein
MADEKENPLVKGLLQNLKWNNEHWAEEDWLESVRDELCTPYEATKKEEPKEEEERPPESTEKKGLLQGHERGAKLDAAVKDDMSASRDYHHVTDVWARVDLGTMTLQQAKNEISEYARDEFGITVKSKKDISLVRQKAKEKMLLTADTLKRALAEGRSPY